MLEIRSLEIIKLLEYLIEVTQNATEIAYDENHI